MAKTKAWVLQQTSLEDKIARKAQDRNVATENIVKMMKQEKQSIQEGIDLQQTRGRNNKQPVLKTEITDSITVITTIVYTQEEITLAAAKINLCHQSQMVGTAFCQPALFDAFGRCADNEDNSLGVLNGSIVPQKDANPHAVSLLETMVKLEFLRDCGPIYCIPTLVEFVDTW